MAIELVGNWKKGFACDVHTLKSVYTGVNEYGYHSWDTIRTEMGELVHQLKNRGDKSAVEKIVDLLLLQYQWPESMDAIIPIPPTNRDRAIQPVREIAREFGARIGVPVLEDVIEKRSRCAELKNVDDPETRKDLLTKYMVLTGKHDLAEKNILLMDDVYRSGSTLWVATDKLYSQAGAGNVFVLTMTKTRSRR